VLVAERDNVIDNTGICSFFGGLPTGVFKQILVPGGREGAGRVGHEEEGAENKEGGEESRRERAGSGESGGEERRG
jgi:hypothetical protein